MNTITKDLLKEIKKDAKEYISLIKGKNLSNTDLMIAENLIVLGYLKARAELMSSVSFNNTNNLTLK